MVLEAKFKMVGVPLLERSTPLTYEEFVTCRALKRPRGFAEILDMVAYDLEEDCLWRTQGGKAAAVKFQTEFSPHLFVKFVERIETLAANNSAPEFTFAVAPGFHVYGPQECERYSKQFQAIDVALSRILGSTWALKHLEFYEMYWFYAMIRIFRLASDQGAVFTEWEL